MRSGVATRTTCFPRSRKELINLIAEVEVQAFVGSDQIENQMAETLRVRVS